MARRAALKPTGRTGVGEPPRDRNGPCHRVRPVRQPETTTIVRPNSAFRGAHVSGPVIVNNRDNNNGLLLGIVLTIVVLVGLWWFLFANGGNNGNGNGNGNGGNNPVPTIAVPQGS
jgi:hypothetical protein